jgi:nicotinate-nucleotide adenylyltransferase
VTQIAPLPKTRIGVFGGAFDPPHLGHALLLQTAVDQLQLDKVVVLPTGQAWHKDRPLTQASHRLAMAELAFADMPAVEVDVREIRRSGPTYTFDTLTELRAENPQAQLHLLMGLDQWARFGSWYRAADIAALAIICVAFRADSSGAPAQNGTHPPPPMSIAMPSMDLSSTAIRSAVARHQSLDGLVFAPVARYIEQHHLYQDT